jgi:host factor-I protein
MLRQGPQRLLTGSSPKAMATERPKSLQDTFLDYVREQKTPVTVFLVNGVKLQGVVASFDNFSIVLVRDGFSQLIYKHAISTVMPSSPIKLGDDEPVGTPR